MEEKPLEMPPRIKCLEALSAVWKGRVRRVGDGEFEVVSSRGERTYRVIIKGQSVFSDDNGTIYRGYIGYPIIAALIVLGILPNEERLGRAIADVEWATLNETLKSYRKVEERVKAKARESGISSSDVDGYVETCMRELSKLSLRFSDLRQTTLF